MAKTVGEGGGRAKPKTRTRTKAYGLGATTGGSKGRGAAPKAGGGIDLPKFAGEVSRNFSRGVGQATKGLKGPSLNLPTGGIKNASGKSGAASGSYLRKTVRGGR